jgi:class 3 adenylate cyclase
MDFYTVLDQVLALLRQRQRVTYRALKVKFQLDDETLEALRDELIEAQHLAADEAGKVLVWTGGAGSSPAPTPEPVCAPHVYTPPHLAEKILTSRSVLAGERKQVTVLFADLKGSMELLADRDPEGGARASRSGAGAHDGSRAPLRRHREPGHGRWHYGPVWSADCA